MEGNLEEARRRFEEGKSLCKGIEFREGIERADESLKELEGKI